MPKITVRKCPQTGRLFESDVEYREYIHTFRKRTNTDRAALRIRRIAVAEVRDEIASLQSIDQIESYITETFSKILMAYNGGNPKAQKVLSKVHMKDLLLDVNFSESCSNTHDAPRSGKTNWGGHDEDVSRGYPGWIGAISYRIINNPENHPDLGNLCMHHSDALGFIGIHTGTGGGRELDKWHYGVTLFLDDFEGLKKLYFKDKLANRLDLW